MVNGAVATSKLTRRRSKKNNAAILQAQEFHELEKARKLRIEMYKARKASSSPDLISEVDSIEHTVAIEAPRSNQLEQEEVPALDMTHLATSPKGTNANGTIHNDAHGGSDDERVEANDSLESRRPDTAGKPPLTPQQQQQQNQAKLQRWSATEYANNARRRLQLHEVEHTLEAGKLLHRKPKKTLPLAPEDFDEDATEGEPGDEAVEQRKKHMLLLQSAAAFTARKPAGPGWGLESKHKASFSSIRAKIRAKDREGDAPREAAVRVGAAKAAQEVRAIIGITE